MQLAEKAHLLRSTPMDSLRRTTWVRLRSPILARSHRGFLSNLREPAERDLL
jgi:hypothetical protein